MTAVAVVRDGRTLTYYRAPITGGWERLRVRPDGWGVFTPVAGEEHDQEWTPDLVAASLSQGGWTDGYESDEEYLDNVECAGCGETRGDAMTCEVARGCEERGCGCVVAKIASCDWTDGMYGCEEHTPSHRGCPECDPVMPWEE